MLISSLEKIALICFKLQTVRQEFVVVNDDGLHESFLNRNRVAVSQK